MTTILMTSPASFNINYSINPWMNGNVNSLNENHIRMALQQWSELRNILVSLDVDVFTLPKPPENCPDAVFTANAGLLYGDTFIPSYFKHPERQVEEPYFTEWFRSKGYKIPVIEGTEDRSVKSFEGAGDALIDSWRGILWFGHGFRSTKNFIDDLNNIISNATPLPIMDEDNEPIKVVLDVELVDERFYHLDTCFCPTDTGKLLWYPAAFSQSSQHTIRSVYGDDAIEVSEEDALLFACNAISLGNRLILPFVSADLLKKIIKAGLEPIRHGLSQFLKSGGSAKCLILKVQ